MFSQRGVMHLAHTVHDLQEVKRRLHANRLNGVDSEFLTPEADQARSSRSSTPRSSARYPILGASLQRRGGTARHDAVAWGYARGADALRRRHHPELRGDRHRRSRAAGSSGVETTRGAIRCQQAGRGRGRPLERARRHGGLSAADRKLSAAGAGLGAGQALRQHGDHVERRARLHQPVGQGRAGDRRRHGSVRLLQPARLASTSSSTRCRRSSSCFPASRACACCASGAASSTSRPTASPIIGRTPVENLYINCGWGTGGFKATPGSGHVFAHTVAKGEPHPINAPFTLERFSSGELVDEHGAAAVAH